MLDIFDKYADLETRFDQVLQSGRNPFGSVIEEVLSPTKGLIKGQEIVLAGTNNYLGLNFHTPSIDAAKLALETQGTGTTGSRIANGTYSVHRKLEEDFANFFGKEHAIVFSTGYQANLATISGLAGDGDTILADADNHASLWDGCRLSMGETVVFRHNDPDHLDKRLNRLGGQPGSKLIVVESLYSMLGDTAPLKEFVEVKNKHNAWLLVDEAHSFGVYGSKGRGVCEEQGVEEDVDFIVGTFSKSLAGIGGFAVSNHPKFELLRFCAKPYMFTASPNPASMAAAVETLKAIEDGAELRQKVWTNAQRLHQGMLDTGYKLGSQVGPIVAVVMPGEGEALWAWNELINQGVYCNLAVPPGTPENKSLLRLSVSAAHSFDEIDKITTAFARLKDGLLTFEDRKQAAC